MKRCFWATTEEMKEYHDKEWGVPIHDDQKIFEFITLEGVQAGLSWSIVLKKRENYRKLFDNFDANKIAKYNEKKIEKLLQNPGIIRNRLKTQAIVNNAQRFLEIQKEFGSFSKYMWSFVNGKPIKNKIKELKDYPTTTEISDKFSKDLKQRGFKFIGSTIIYAHMQAVGMVNDHTVDCFRYNQI